MHKLLYQLDFEKKRFLGILFNSNKQSFSRNFGSWADLEVACLFTVAFLLLRGALTLYTCIFTYMVICSIIQRPYVHTT